MAAVSIQEIDESQPRRVDNSKLLVSRLDELLKEYLNLLDKYQETRADLSKHFSNGFINLAQANFASKTRFGQDFYDDRLQASRKISIQADNAMTNVKLDNVEKAEAGNEQDKKHGGDPIRMFGLFVPPALRSAQKEFSTAVSGPLISLLNLDKRMNCVEIEVRRIRKQLSKIGD